MSSELAFALVFVFNLKPKPKPMMQASAQAPASSQRVKPQHPKPQHLNLKLLMPIPGIGESGLRLPYGPRERSMLFCEYLRDVIYVELRDNGGRGYASLMDDGATVRGCLFHYNAPEVLELSDSPDSSSSGEVVVQPSKQYAFNHANRLLKMSDVIPHGDCDIFGVKEIGGPRTSEDGQTAECGNALARDVRVECAICLDISPINKGGNGLVNFALQGCPGLGDDESKRHWFHQECLALLSTPKCPLCRAPFASQDQMCLLFTKARMQRQKRSALAAAAAAERASALASASASAVAASASAVAASAAVMLGGGRSRTFASPAMSASAMAAVAAMAGRSPFSPPSPSDSDDDDAPILPRRYSVGAHHGRASVGVMRPSGHGHATSGGGDRNVRRRHG